MKLSDLYPQNTPEPIEVSMEDMFNLASFNGYVSGFINKMSGIFDSKKLIPTILIGSELHTAMKLVSSKSRFDLENFTVITPCYVSGPLLPYVNELKTATGILSTIDARLLTPIEKWAANLLSDPDYWEKVWLNIPSVENNGIATSVTENLHKYFAESTGDGLSTQHFSKTYENANGLQHVDTELNYLVSTSTKLLDGKLSIKANGLAKLITQLTNKQTVKTNFEQLPVEKLRPVVDLVLEAARELELLAIVLFQIRTASYAHKETLKKINTQLK